MPVLPSAPTANGLTLITDSFRLWLISKKYSDSTTRNYLVDVNKFLHASCPAADPASPLSVLLSVDSLSSYLTQIAAQNNYRRQLASLSQFCQFALDQKLVNQNHLKQALRHQTSQSSATPAPGLLLSRFADYLNQHHKTNLTIKNYINDLRQYLTWVETDNSSGL